MDFVHLSCGSRPITPQHLVRALGVCVLSLMKIKSITETLVVFNRVIYGKNFINLLYLSVHKANIC